MLLGKHKKKKITFTVPYRIYHKKIGKEVDSRVVEGSSVYKENVENNVTNTHVTTMQLFQILIFH